MSVRPSRSRVITIVVLSLIATLVVFLVGTARSRWSSMSTTELRQLLEKAAPPGAPGSGAAELFRAKGWVHGADEELIAVHAVVPNINERVWGFPFTERFATVIVTTRLNDEGRVVSHQLISIDREGVGFRVQFGADDDGLKLEPRTPLAQRLREIEARRDELARPGQP